ncbi:MAG: hypothetical protein ABSF90_23210 [Syntrophobacteraceae bacterium]|jgi:uracil permease
MDKSETLYDLDDHLSLRLAVLYAFQWTIIIFPVPITLAILPARVLQMGPAEEVRFLQPLLLSSGVFTTIQCLWGHRYPIIDGPSTALLLTFLLIAPYGLPAVQAGGIAGGLLLMAAVIIVKPKPTGFVSGTCAMRGPRALRKGRFLMSEDARLSRFAR